MSEHVADIPPACDEEFLCPGNSKTYRCTRARGHDGNHVEIGMLQAYCHHPTQRNGRCAICGIGLVDTAREPQISARQLPAVEPKVQTAAVSFGDDWPGVFFRGDHAYAYASILRCVLREHPTRDPKLNETLSSLAALLESCDVQLSERPGVAAMATTESVTVRIALVIDRRGNWHACGWSGAKCDDELLGAALGGEWFDPVDAPRFAAQPRQPNDQTYVATVSGSAGRES